MARYGGGGLAAIMILAPTLLILLLLALPATTITVAAATTTSPAHSGSKTLYGSICTKTDRACAACVKSKTSSKKSSTPTTCTACPKGDLVDSVLIDSRCYCPAGSGLAGSTLTTSKSSAAASSSSSSSSSSSAPAHANKNKSKSSKPRLPTCAPCAVDAFASTANLVTAARCQPCAGGSTTRGNTGSATCFVEPGFYFDAALQQATPCPNGYTCQGGDISAEGQEYVDVDECEAAESPCPNRGVCVNKPGSFECDCQGTGYTGTTCETDIDECAAAQSPCVETELCINTQGSFNCVTLTNGRLNVAYFTIEGEPEELPDYSSLTPYLTTTVQSIDFALTMDGFANSGLAESVGARFTGYVDVPVEGLWTFYVKSDDGSKLWIDDALIIDHDGLHMMTEKSGQVQLAAGLHKLQLDYLEYDGAAGLILAWAGPGTSKQVIPTANLRGVA